MKGAIWYKHDSNSRNDQRIIKVRMKYGMEGYGIYHGIIETLCETEKYNLKLIDIDAIAWDFRVDKEMVDDIIYNYDLFVIEDEILYSKSLLRRMNALDEKKTKLVEAGRKGGLKGGFKGGSSDAKATPKHIDKNRIDKNRVDKSIKEYKEKISLSFDLFWNLYDYKQLKPDCEAIWNGEKKNKRGLLFNDEVRQAILDHLPAYVENTHKDGDFPQRKHPKTYLNNNGWEDEVVIPEAIEQAEFKLDSTGFPMAYCESCGISDSYKLEDLSGDSKCCKAKLLPNKPKGEPTNGRHQNLVEQSKRFRSFIQNENNSEKGTSEIGQIIGPTIESLTISPEEEGDGQ